MANIICYKKFDKIFSVLFFLLVVMLWQGNGFLVIAGDVVIFDLSGIDEIVESNPEADIAKIAEYNNLGNEYYAKKEFDKAIENYQKAIDLLTTDENKNSRIAATLYNNTGLATTQLKNLAKALEWHQKALAIREKELGKNHPDIANSYNNIGIIYSRQGDYDKAGQFYHDALTLRRQLFGFPSSAEVDILNNIGILQYKQKRYKEAIDSVKSAYENYFYSGNNDDDNITIKIIRQNLKIIYNDLYKNSNRISFEDWIGQPRERGRRGEITLPLPPPQSQIPPAP
ncbi:MAG: tetratricopeptide repeat protein [Planctomycetaceae bacterium]|jgi:tetratricopeptide (TPR) repeat protein|nr:tetratricopeptide repeat protein [Planctomycetaceae bacterium]